MFCRNCGSSDLLELGIEKGESWYYCYHCKSCFGDFCPEIPLDEFCNEMIDQGFPEDAARLKRGERASEIGE